MNIISRWWQSRGFGIQSKTDFAYLHEVLRERLPYYAYDDLKRLFPHASNREQRRAQLLFRITNSLRPSLLLTYGQPKSLNIKACEMATNANREEDRNATVTLVEGAVSQQDRTALMAQLQGSIASSDSNSLRKIWIICNIDSTNLSLWQEIEAAHCISYDMSSIGVAIFYPDRYPAHYHILSPDIPRW